MKALTLEQQELKAELMKARRALGPDDLISKGAEVDAAYTMAMLQEQAAQYERRLRQAGWVISALGALCMLLSVLLVLK